MVRSIQKTIEKQPEGNKSSDSKLFAGTAKLHAIQRGIEKFLEKWTRKKLNQLKIAQQFESQEKAINFSRWVNRF